MAKIEVEPGSTSSAHVLPTTKSKKRKLKDIQANDDDDDGGRSTEADSPTTKFKKLDISQIRKRRRHPHSQPVVSPPQTAAVVSASATAITASTAVAVIATELQQAATDPKNNTQKATKRKPKTYPNGAKPSKKSKSASSGSSSMNTNDNEADDENGGGEDDDEHTPTPAELSAADRPENVPQIETTRQKKRDKHAKVQQTAKVDSAEREHLRNREYLVQWRDQRDSWKFNKLRQISVTKALFREVGNQQLDDEMWQLAMEYLCGTKGQLRQLLRDDAQKVIDDTDARIVAEQNEALVQSLNYTRARSFLQMME